MKPISTEDDYMKKLYIAIFFASIIIMLINSFLITPSSILDTDPSTYIIVPMIMLPLFAIFIFKNRIDPAPDKKSIAIGAALFAIFVIVVAYLHYLFSFLFFSYRLDMLAFPLALASIVVTMFGFKNINFFKAMLIYAIFASPLLLVPIFSLNGQFAEANAYIVYTILHSLDNSTVFVPPISIIERGYTVGIGESCAGIGALIGIIMFLAPVAYLLNGKAKMKALWVFSGFLLLLLLNIIRMFGIALAWFYYGPNAGISFTHSFAGILIFYIAIIIVVLIPKAFKLEMPKISKAKKKRAAKYSKLEAISLILPIIYSIIYYFLSLNYLSAAFISPTLSYANTLNADLFRSFVSNNVNTTGMHGLFYKFSNVSDLFLLTNSTFNSSNPIAMLVTPYSEENSIFSNVSIKARETFLNKDGLNVDIYKIYYNNTNYFVAIKKVPYVFGDSYTIIAEYAIMPESAGELGLKCNSQKIYDELYSLFGMGIYNYTTSRELESAYCVNEKIFR